MSYTVPSRVSIISSTSSNALDILKSVMIGFISESNRMLRGCTSLCKTRCSCRYCTPWATPSIIRKIEDQSSWESRDPVNKLQMMIPRITNYNTSSLYAAETIKKKVSRGVLKYVSIFHSVNLPFMNSCKLPLGTYSSTQINSLSLAWSFLRLNNCTPEVDKTSWPYPTNFTIFL